MPNLNDRKFRELLLYVAQKSLDDPAFGAMKLNKLMFYIDFLAYGMFGKAVTGARYQKLEHGPAPVALVPVRQKMEQAKEVVIAPTQYFNRTINRWVALRQPDLSVFNSEEIALVDDVLGAMREYDGTGISKLSHLEVGWRFAKLNEDIPYNTTLDHEIRSASFLAFI